MNKEVTSSFITKSKASSASNKMSVLPDTGIGPPVINAKPEAWSLTETKSSEKVDDWIEDNIKPVIGKSSNPSVVTLHPLNAAEQTLLEDTVFSMRNNLMSNTAVMSLLDQPVSVFEDQEESPDVVIKTQNDLNKELEEFLAQIREIRDGKEPEKPSELTKEITVHINEQREAVEKALSALDRELTEDSGVNGSEVENDEEFREIISEVQSEVQSDTNEAAIHENEDSNDEKESKTTDLPPIDEHKINSEIPIPTTIPSKKMGLYELLSLHPDVKVRKAALTMKRLDEQLRLVRRKEREVKKQREILNKQLLLFASGEMLVNGGNKDEIPDDITIVSDLDTDITPIFPTQIDDSGENSSTSSILPPISDTSTGASTTSLTAKQRKKGKQSSRSSKQESPKTIPSTSGTRSKRQIKTHAKNFLARNKELAGNASDVIAMTETEKERLLELLHDIDDIDDDGKLSTNTVSLIDGCGFTAQPEDEKRLSEIDSKLVVDESGSLSICSFYTENSKVNIYSKVMTELQKRCPAMVEDDPGDGTLKMLRSQKVENEKIQIIDELLCSYTNDDELPEVKPADLQELLAEIRRSLPGPETPTEFLD